MEFLSYSVLILGLFNILSGQYIESPCPDIFQYRSEGFDPYGLIHLKSTGPVSYIIIRANFTIATRLFDNYVGRLEPVGNNLNALQDFNNGSPIDYRVHFPISSPLPRLTALTVNDALICYGPGDVPGPNQYVTTTSLQHTLYLRGQVNTQSSDGQIVQTQWTTRRPAPQPPPEPQYYPEADTEPPPPPLPPPTTQRPWPRPQPRPQPQPQPQPQPPIFHPTPSRPVQSSVECGTIATGNGQQALVYNGQSYLRGEWPWLVAIYRRREGSLSFICSGTLVSQRHVITAAHCMNQQNHYTATRDIVVKVGVYNLEDWGDDITITRKLVSATIHESYNATSLANDLMVMTFEKNIEYNDNIRPACLWSGNPDINSIVGQSGAVAGWGQSEFGPAGTGDPRVVRMPIVSTSDCRASRPDFHRLTSSNTLCAGDRKGAGPCLGDSGGGLYVYHANRWQLRGVVSLSLRDNSGDRPCDLNEYIVFTDSAQYLPWLRNAMTN